MNRFRTIFSSFLIALALFIAGCAPGDSNESSESHEPATGEDSVLVEQEERKELTGEDIRLEKNFRYEEYLLDDEYPYQDTVRRFQWEKIREQIAVIENAVADGGNWGVLSNYRNMNKEAPTVNDFVRNDYGRVSDQHGVERYQSAPLYTADGDTALTRYGRDGWIVKLPESDTVDMVRVQGVSFKGEYLVPNRYVISWRDSVKFHKVIAVDVTNQNIATLEKTGDEWHVLSMNPATTGVHRPPYAHETPVGVFAMQEQKEKMYYTRDGTSEIAGFAPYASRFTNGGYVHGVPTQYPNKSIIEYSQTLGTIPRSHMCVRNASSHSKFVYDWANVRETVVIVID